MAEQPRKQNALFQSGTDQYAGLNACVGQNGGRYDLYDYACGYFEATETLLKAAKHGKVTIDDIVYPVCLTFRHGVELFVKFLVTQLALLNDSEDKFEQKHSILANWKIVLKHKKSFSPQDADFEKFNTVVNAIEEIDAYGMTFRYPDDRDGGQHLVEWPHINLHVLQLRHKEIADISKKWYSKMESLREAKATS
ncbi:hypothetical protein JQ574_25355 [Bradyrhizobium sp. AUGA SZCCT0158]|uniref:hypothetical protein n=1 Tax=Bradyrhizobium sp. AUGA SZCCT0158 TaxID=2807661 RepID=UPI001BAAC06B|nr:hypothetical protein [Bradyrhizobium sp. AUGA SZCCT0158]MBR1199329.1 hypothetical protein [Bradyrhizobium sp. AUGA SZCCT0158]